MSKNHQPRRVFKYADPDMMRRTQLHHDLFVKYLPDFTAFNTGYNTAFAEAWQSEIEKTWQLLGTKYRTPIDTEDLVLQLNKLWGYSQQIASAGKLIYRNTNPARYGMFVLSRS